MGKRVNKRGIITIEILSLIFVPGFLTLFIVSKVIKYFNQKA